jgi:UbiD family decarboxylase
MKFSSLGEFIKYLEAAGELKRIRQKVDPELELTEIAVRALREKRPAILFEDIKGSEFGVSANIYASEKRIELALGRHPEQIGEELVSFFNEILPLKISSMWRNRSALRKLLGSGCRKVRKGNGREKISPPDLTRLPIQKCWPGDGGRFITQGEVFTYDPEDGRRNVGMYRMHVYDRNTTGMHWQIQKGGGFHYSKAEKLNRKLEVGVALGSDPALLLASVSALPEGLDEVLFASFIRGEKIPLMKGTDIGIDLPADAEFILEGIVHPRERRQEGPFGDHFGHYSTGAPFPVFHLKKITHKKNPVYPAAVVGIPPMEDKFLGDASQQILGPLIKLIHREIKGLWAYYEAGFHNLLVASVEERYKKEALKAALGLLGTEQLALTKTLILVSEQVDPQSWTQVLKEIRNNFDPACDFILIPNVFADTLDFTGRKMETGSKMIIDATRKRRNQDHAGRRTKDIPDLSSTRQLNRIRSLDGRITDVNLISGTLLIVKVKKEGRRVVEKLVGIKELQSIKIIAAVSEDINIRDQENYIWGIFTRFDCERDVIFNVRRLEGIAPFYKGAMGIDATWKKEYPAPLEMEPNIIKNVDDKWKEFWK